MTDAAEWLDRRALAEHISVRVDELPRLQKASKLPRPSYHLGPKTPRWRRQDVDAMFGGERDIELQSTKPDPKQINARIVQNILRGRV